ncbi:7-cyano-7-deazaguanine synthase QueC [Campylobacter geochelonis]|uniref:7-cyano-7-deazaguanine synthase n=1 Tax=Campylobacter geochelonis TaxID=1780362 RepID=A0A128ES02_9BACT|nr:7-cyano-7-deazaguanine synthase QueC [Campylobacter geochelonis]QKF71668.1 7-cyano-7-deazaguanine synthase [Campylobacter geochelonis]CZE49317.1 ExsB protein [Campylobacter geochelonis]CZE49416.1 ExsB protein [Campylobacter geochelonis]CZE51499.1 ExsB protein [Campylobacter geochelonis]
MKKAVCVISGGMDSTLCAYIAKNEGYEIVALHFDYNQRTMEKERESFYKICDKLGVKTRLVLDVSFISQIGANALTDKTLEVPKDGLGAEVPITYVPFRNGIFLSIAAALAEKEGCEAIFIGVVEEDSSGYPDCSESFIKSMQESINLGRATKVKSQIKMPLVHLSKAQIVEKALNLGVALELTWSCYENSDEACGVCDSCRLRLNGFKQAGFKDKIPYKNCNKN